MTPSGSAVAIGAVLAAASGLAGASALAGAWRRRVSLLVLMASAGLAARAVVSPPATPPFLRFDSAIYGIALAFEAVGVLTAATLLRGPRRGLLPPVIAIVTGLHVLGLWAAAGRKLFLGLALGLCAAGFIALGWPRRPGGPDPRLPIAGLGSAFVLWAACLSSFL
jgi:hypothetical protein